MTLTVSQKILIFIIKVGINIIWFFDRIAIAGKKKIRHKLVLAVLYIINFTALFLLVFSFYSGFWYELAKGAFYTINGYETDISISSGSNVLGSGSVYEKLPVKISETGAPEVTAQSVLIVDKATSKVLYQKNPEDKLAPASTTKLMTALVALDIYELNEALEMSEDCININSTKANLVIGEKYYVRDLIYSLLISSAADSACVLSRSQVSYGEFLSLMNKKAYSLSMDNTFFMNPIGLDGFSGSHFSTSSDLYKLTVEALKKPEIKEAVSLRSYTFTSVSGEEVLTVYTTNQLLKELPGTVGVKTGTTVEARQVLIYQYNNDGIDLVIVTMGGNDRFGDTKKLLDWALDNYSWKIL